MDDATTEPQRSHPLGTVLATSRNVPAEPGSSPTPGGNDPALRHRSHQPRERSRRAGIGAGLAGTLPRSWEHPHQPPHRSRPAGTFRPAVGTFFRLYVPTLYGNDLPRRERCRPFSERSQESSFVKYVTTQRRNSPRWEPVAGWRWRASPGPWCSSEKAFELRSSRMPAKAEALGSLDDSSGVAVVDGSTGGAAVLALLRRSRST